jgi:hypothetical protein
VRTATAAELLTLALLTRTVTVRVKVANGSGTMVDLSSWYEGITRNEDVDQPVAGATVEFTRASGVLQTLSPLRTDSTLNRLDDGVTYSPEIDLVRAITIEVATTPVGVLPSGSDFKLKFKGTTATVNFASNPIVVDCRDEGGLLVDRWVETLQSYGSGPGVALETVMQSIHDNVLGAGIVPVWTPVSPVYLISPAYQQQLQSVMDADVALAQLPGWDVRYRWDDGTGAFRFKLSQPDRTKVIPDYTFGPNGYFDVSSLELSELDIRNVIILSYPEPGNRATITVTDSASITKYRRRPLLITEGDTSPINSSGEATTMANAALADLKDPKAEMEIVLPFFWPGELGDYYRFSANGVHFNTDQDWAVVSITDDLSPGRHETRIKVRGKPAGQYLTWLGRGPRGGSPGSPNGTAVPPVPFIRPLNTELNDSSWDLQFNATLGSGGGGANLSYTITSKKTFGVTTTEDSGNASAFPRNLTIVRDPKYDKTITFTVIDAATAMTRDATFTVPASRGEINATGNIIRAHPLDDGGFALNATEVDGTTKSSAAFAPQGSTIPAPTDTGPFAFNSGGPSTGNMWLAWTWSSFLIYKPDGTTITVPASASLATPPSPVMSAVVAGALGARTLFARIGYSLNGLVYRVGAEASLALAANRTLKITSPAVQAGYDGWVVWVGNASNGETIQSFLAFGTDYTENPTGFLTGTTPYDNTKMPNAVVSTSKAASSTYFYYPWYELATAFVGFGDNGQLTKTGAAAQKQNMDGRIGLMVGGMQGLTPVAGSPGSGGTLGGGKYLG